MEYVLKYMGFTLTWISLASSPKKDKSQLDLLSDTDMLLMVKKGIRCGICHDFH